MTAVMGRPRFPAPDIHRAAQDVAYFDEQIGHFGDRYRERNAFIDAVLAAWHAAHPDARGPLRDDESGPAPRLTYVERRVLVFAAEKLPRFRSEMLFSDQRDGLVSLASPGKDRRTDQQSREK